MSQDWYADVLEFHKAYGCAIGDKPRWPSPGLELLRQRLTDEEYKETGDAAASEDFPGLVDGHLDLIYILIGNLISFGVDPRPLWDEIQRANMSKLPLRKDAQGKVLKPPGWKPPDIEGLLHKQGWAP